MCHYERRHSIYMYVGTLAYTHPPSLAWWCTYIRPSESSEYNRLSEYCTHAYTTCTEAVPTTGIKKNLFALNHYMCSSEQSPYMTYYAPSSGVVGNYWPKFHFDFKENWYTWSQKTYKRWNSCTAQNNEDRQKENTGTALVLSVLPLLCCELFHHVLLTHPRFHTCKIIKDGTPRIAETNT